MTNEMYAFHTGSRPVVGARICLNPEEVLPQGAATVRAEYVITKVTHQGDGSFLLDITPEAQG